MDSLLSSKPLNPRAQSWFPDAKKPSEDFKQAQKLPFHLPHEIYGTVSTYVSSAMVCDPFSQPPPLQLHPSVVIFQAPHEGSFHYAVFSSYPVYPSYSYQQAFDGLLMQEKDSNVKDVTMENSNSLKKILGTPRSESKNFRKFVPPRLRSGYFNEFQGRKRLPRKVWKPKKTEIVPLASLAEEDCPDCEKTTVMVKNIPNQYRRDSFMAFLNKKCFELRLAYDFLYLPMDFVKGDNLGFAFVNFTTASAATKFKSAMEGYKWGEFYIGYSKFYSRKILQITWARIQGKGALIRHFEKSHFTCDNIQYLPVVIFPPSNGRSFISSLNTIGELRGCRKFSNTKEITKRAV